MTPALLQGSSFLPAVVAGAQQPPTMGDAPVICLVGLAVVFSGLVLLCLFMLGMMRLLEPGLRVSPAPEEEPVESDPPVPVPVEVEVPREVEKKSEPDGEIPAADWEPEEGPELVPMTLLAAAVMAYHLYERNLLQLGRPTSFLLLGRERQVTLLSAGHVNRALVDGEEVVFNLSEVAGNDAVGRSIAPADF